MSTLYRTAYHVDMKTTSAWYKQKRPRTGTRLELLVEEGLVLKILITLVQRFIFMHFQYGGFHIFFVDGQGT